MRCKCANFVVIGGLVAAIVCGASAFWPGQVSVAGGQETEAVAARSQQPSGDAMIEAIRETEGCLAVDAGQWMSGKQSIVAFFESKDAVIEWFYSDFHQQMMEQMTEGADYSDFEPLAHVDDDTGPIMVIATLTMSDSPQFEGLLMPVSQISIELFKPLPGGVYMGGRLAPPDFEVPEMRGYDGPANRDAADGDDRSP